MRGRLIYVMGPSGAGKDSLLLALRPRLEGEPVAFVRRCITRPASAGGERHIAVSHERFEELSARGHFSLQWKSHGLRYGIPAAWERLLERGTSLIVNGSRAAFPEARRRHPDLIPVLVSAPVPVLRARLIARGRESGSDLEERLQSALAPVPGAASVSGWIRIDNSGCLEDAADALAQSIRNALTRRNPGQKS